MQLQRPNASFGLGARTVSYIHTHIAETAWLLLAVYVYSSMCVRWDRMAVYVYRTCMLGPFSSNIGQAMAPLLTTSKTSEASSPTASESVRPSENADSIVLMIMFTTSFIFAPAPASPAIVWPFVKVVWPVIKVVWPLIKVFWPLVKVVRPVVKVDWPLIKVVWPLIKVVWPLIKVVWPLIKVVWPLVKVFFWGH